MVYQMSTHTSQCPPAEVTSEATNYMVYMHQMVSGSNCDWHFILNIDQTPVYFVMSTKHMLELFDKKTIHICMTADDTKRVMVAMTITADGTLLPAMVVVKGLAKRQVPNNQPLPLPSSWTAVAVT